MATATNAISNWYNSSLWNRSRQLQVAPLLARAEENARNGRTPAEAVVINMGDILADDPTLLNSIKPKKHETLFGPALGPVNNGPAWTNYGKVENIKDELTQETVKAWIAKSKEPSQPTTTLQALVNLKRPSIRLSPLTHADGEDDAPATHHGLEFEYDLDAARGKIVLEVISPDPDTPPILIYETTVDGGFAKHVTLEDGVAFELAKLEQHKAPAPEIPPQAAEVIVAPSSASAPVPAAKKRFSAFPFRKKRTRAAGPAVAVVDAQTPAPALVNAEDQPTPKIEEKSASEDDGGGVRVRIRIEALDETDKPLAAPNAQTTYLHIVSLKPTPSAPAEGEEPPADEDSSTAHWMVKVVKREATIGLHTFHLHEIYGLASSAPSTTASPPSHSYPPNADDSNAQATQTYDFAGTECVLCLSEPREVVLLPCRHLVACKDCALNMIEFGAGGQVTQATEDAVAPAPPTTPGANPNATEGELEAGLAGQQGAGGAGAAAPAATPAAPRRKRKAKGWFCPVCRQPYTSLLRITTTPPDAKKIDNSSEPELPIPVSIPDPTSVPVSAPTALLSSTLPAVEQSDPAPEAMKNTTARRASGEVRKPGTPTGTTTDPQQPGAEQQDAAPAAVPSVLA